MWVKLHQFFVIFVLINVSQTSLIGKEIETRIADENEVEDGKSSLVFVFDTTGSMYNDLKQLREGAEMILKTALEESDIIGDFVFVPFHDPAVGPATVTRDKEVFKTALDMVSVYGGGDCPEKSLGGIQLALNVSSARSFIYVFTDATAGDHRLVGKVLDSVQRKQTQVVFVLTGHCNDLEKPTYQVYQQIAAASSGQVFNLNKTSVHKVLDFVKSSIKGRTVNLESSVNPAGYNNTQNIPVDSSLGEVTVSVSGSKPQITVVDPSGVQLTGPPKLITTLDLSEIMVVKVLQPEPGNWSITVGSEDDYSVKVVGLSNLTFSHGFSVQPPKDMTETSYRPLEGTYNHMLIRLPQAAPVTLTHASVVSLSGRTLYELPLQAAGSLYTASAFIPPDDFFYIAINGRDETGQEFRRIGTTAIQAKSPDVPYLSAPKKVHAHSHSRVVLRCKVESLVPVTATWSREYDRIQRTTSSLQTTSIEYVIEDMTEAEVGRYRCNAKNVAGTSRADTHVILLVDPPLVSVEPATVTLNPGEGANISCTVYSEALLLKFQFLRLTNHSTEVLEVSTEPTIDGIYTTNLTLEDVSTEDAGNYTCLAANRGGSANQTAELIIESSPTAQILGPHELSVKKNENTTIYCLVQHSIAISWLKNGTQIKEVAVNKNYTDFLVLNVTEDEEIICKAERGNLSAFDSVKITALIKPEVSILGSKNITVLNGTTIEVSCEVTAKPAPRVLWYRGSEEKFLNHTLTMLDSQTYRSALLLNSTEQNINGSYFCVGENSLGIQQDRVDVVVRREMALIQGFNDTSVQLYQSVKLPCNIDAHPSPTITWYHNNTLLTSNENIQISGDDKNLFIAKVDFVNFGIYSCVGHNEYEKMAVNGSLNVVDLDAPILARDQPKRKIVKQGESTIFTCSILKGNPEPILKWQFNRIESSDLINLDNLTKDGFQLMIGNVSRNNAGTYICVAENVVGRDELQMELVVHYLPQFKSADLTEANNLGNLETEVGKSVKFSCEAEGYPPPIVTWNKNGRPVVYGKNIRTTNGSLVIEKVSQYDSGLFTCEAKSPVGSVGKNFTLVVFQSPEISPPTIATELEFLEGELIELPCEAAGLPLPEVTWTHNGDEVSGDRKFIDEFGIRFIANLTDFGDYTCVAKNRYGNNSLTYSLFIWVPPFIEPPLQVSINIKAGQNISLQCDVIGFPVPNILWEFNNETLKENTTEISFNEVGNLFVANTSSKHEGMYVCVAENIAGVVRKYFDLTVNEPPRITDDNYTYVATNMDSAVMIDCKTTGKPKPYVVWSKDHVYLDKDARYDMRSDGSLTIKAPTEDMSGNYTCMAKNSFGTTNKTVEVKIYTLPTTIMQSEASRPVHTVVEHTNTSVDCPTPASHTDTVKWYKDATLLSTGKLQINNISRDDQTTYACVVSNAVGSAYSAISLSVEWPPTFIDENTEEEDTIKIIHDTIVSNNATNLGNKTNELNKNNESQNKGKDTLNNTIDTIDKKSEAVTEELSKIIDDRNNSEENGITVEDKIIDTVKMKLPDEKVKVIEVVKGDDTYLDCSVDSKPISKTQWLFNSKPLIFADKSKLCLINVRTQNSGAYKCIVGNKHGTVVKEFQVEVSEPPFISEFDFLEVMLMEGVNATLDCDARGNPTPTVKWTFNNTNWHADNTSLVATNVTLDSEGVYRCDATNSAGHAHIIYRVGVVSRAQIEDIVFYRNNEGISVTGTVEAELGSHIRIACKAKGKPTPTIQWIRNGKVLSENKPDISYADLTIDGVETSHAGVYACVVSNEGGNGERNIRIEVLESPKIFRSLFQSDKGNTVPLEVLSGQAYYLHCHAYGNPVPEVYWFRDGLPLMLFDASMVSTEYGEVLQVARAELTQSGNYTCVARNSVGSSSLVYLVDVLVPPPQPKESSHPVSTLAGRPLTLSCPVAGSPPPYVKWNKHPYVEIGEHTPRVKLSEDNVTLFIPVTQVSDSGNYSCIMTNKAGTTEVKFNVSVDKPPSIAGPVSASGVEIHDVSLRGSVVLKCEADGHPLPKISWLKDTQPLSDSATNINRVLGNSLLAIWRAGARDAGQYICVVENKAGSAHRRYNVRVRVPGKWSEWGAWSYCNVTCGLGHQLRARTCRYMDDNDRVIDKTTALEKFILDESACKGPVNETRKCHMPACEESLGSGWSPWSRWAACSASCGAGTQARTRRCRGTCRGDNVQIRKCPNLPKCEWRNDVTENEVIDNNEEFNENNFYAPDAVFEMEPEVVSSHYSPDVEEFYTAGPTGSKPSPVHFDVEVTTNLDGSDPGPCRLGYRYNTTVGACEDIDECVYETNQCHSTQVCVNVAGAYRCSCTPGLEALGAGQRCMDINECAQDTSGCEYACVNVVGGYVCACPRHMRLARDKHHCYTVQSMASSYKKPYSYDNFDTGEYLSTSVEYPARYKHMRT